MRRLFVALSPRPAITDLAMQTVDAVKRSAPKAKWARRESLHLTLVFIGAVPDEAVDDVSEAVALGASHASPLSLRVSGGGSFGSRSRPRVLWLGFDGDLEALATLQRELTELLIPAVDREKRPYRPHLTLARARGPKGDPGLATAAEQLADVESGSVTFREVVLYESALSPAGAKYTVVARHPMG